MGTEAILPLKMFVQQHLLAHHRDGPAHRRGHVRRDGRPPLYLQIVKGSSPTEAGLQLIPLMIGIIVTSAIAGRVMGRTGRYKIFPVAGVALMFAALLLMSTLEVDTPLPQVMSYMLLMGWASGSACRPWSSACRTPCRPRTWESPPAR
jgi:MFS family permease